MIFETWEQWEAHCKTIDEVTKRLSGGKFVFGHQSNTMRQIEETEPIWFEKCQGAEGPCDSEYAYRRSQMTAYADGNNTAVLCDDCQNAANAYWEERWGEYYSACM